MNGIKEMIEVQDLEGSKNTILPMFRRLLKGMPFMAADGTIRMCKGTRITARSVNQAYQWSEQTKDEEIYTCEFSIGSSILVRFSGDIAVELHRVRFSLFLAGWLPVFPLSFEDQS